MQSVTITLNGREVSGYPEMTILQLARESGVNIPTLCDDSHLKPIGACRMCLVEDEPTGRLMASCVTPIAAGMVINTNSPRVIAHRKNIIKLILASHPDSCLVCDKGNQCQLRQIAADMGIDLIRLDRIPLVASIEEVNPFIERDLSKCILCAKCIRACQEMVVVGAIDYYRRGFATRVAASGDVPLEGSECTFCGTCVSLCPTGALMEKDRTYTGTTKDSVETTCPFCGCGCSIRLEVKNNRIVRVKPGKGNGVNKGMLCVRGSYGCDFVHSPDRLTKPLVKRNGNFEPVPWEQALEEVATEFKRIKDIYGADSLAVLGSSKCTNEENYLLQRLTRCVLGTNNIDNGSRLYNAGRTSHSGALEQLERSKVIIVIGANPSSSAPLVSYAIKRAVKQRGAKLILIDPRRTDLVSFAHLWLRPKVGADIALLNSLAKVIIDEGMLNKEAVSQLEGFQALNKLLQKYSPELTESITGVSGEAIRSASRLFATAGEAAIVYGTGITQNSAADGVKALTNLAVLTGNAQRIFPLQRENNGQGACDMGALPDLLPGHVSLADAGGRKRFEELWGASLPAEPGLTAIEMIARARSGEIKGMWIIGENPLLSFPDGKAVSEALGALEFLVVQDMFPTETAQMAKVVLPAASFAEKEGTFTNFEGTVNRVRKAIEPPGESLPDWEVILKLASKMGSPLPFSSAQQIREEIEKLVPSFKVYGDTERRPPGESASSSVAHFSPVEYEPLLSEAEEKYPLTLLTGTVLYSFGSGTRSSRGRRLKRYQPEAFVELGKSDAEKLGVSQGDKVRVVSPSGELTAAASITNTLLEGTLFMPISPGAPVSQLFDIDLNQETKTPSFKTCKVRIERIGA